jgi:hypothetical protein
MTLRWRKGSIDGLRDCLNTSLASTEPQPLVRKSPHISERVLGHAIKGVEGTCDRHEYAEEKAGALKQLDHLIETIINPPRGNVVAIRRPTSSRRARPS